MSISQINKYLYIYILFLGKNGHYYLNMEDNRYEAFFLAAILFVSILWLNKNTFKQIPLLCVLSLVTMEFVIKSFILKQSGAYVYSIPILGAPIGLLAFNDYLSAMNKRKWRILFHITITFFLIECGMAIFERFIGTNFIGFHGGTTMDIETTGIYGFRSTALWAHPLANALVVSFLMSYFLVSNIKLKYKLFLWSVGYIAILCFNTRGSIIVNALVLFVYLCFSFFPSKRVAVSKKIKFLMSVAVLSVLIVFLIFQTGIGGRLIAGSLSDSSVQTRFDIWYVFHVMSDNVFYYGTDNKGVFALMSKSGLYALENFWIMFVMRYGIVFLILYVMGYILLFKQLFSKYELFDKLIVIATFIIIASTNDSLATEFLSLLVFMICSFIFNPNNLNKYIHPKYSEIPLRNKWSKKRSQYVTNQK